MAANTNLANSPLTDMITDTPLAVLCAIPTSCYCVTVMLSCCILHPYQQWSATCWRMRTTAHCIASMILGFCSHIRMHSFSIGYIYEHTVCPLHSCLECLTGVALPWFLVVCTTRRSADLPEAHPAKKSEQQVVNDSFASASWTTCE